MCVCVCVCACVCVWVCVCVCVSLREGVVEALVEGPQHRQPDARVRVPHLTPARLG